MHLNDPDRMNNLFYVIRFSAFAFLIIFTKANAVNLPEIVPCMECEELKDLRLPDHVKKIIHSVRVI
jgi:hypothetical protein